MSASPSVCWCPPCRLPCGPIEWRVMCSAVPCLRIGSGTLHCPAPSRIVQSPFSLCVCCHSIVGLVLCLCDRVVSLWNSGDDSCWVEGRVVFTVYTSSVCGVHLGGVCVVMAVCDDSVCLVLSLCVVGCGMAVCVGRNGGACGGVWSLCLSSLSSSLLCLSCCWCSG